MTFDKKILSDILREMESEREQRANMLFERQTEVYQKIPRIREIDNALKSTASSIMRAALESGDDPTKAIEQLRIRNKSLQREKLELLSKNGLTHDFLSDKPQCEKCSDLGYIGTTPCECLKKRYAAKLTDQLSTILPIKNQNFESFRLDYYPDKYDERANRIPRDLMADNLEDCKDYAMYFSKDSGNLLFYGSSGLGKTFLSSCIAKVVSEAGFSVAYDTAIHIISCYESVKFQHPDASDSQNYIHRFENADLLILDDLGTEMPTQLATSVVYSLVNMRIMKKKPMIISTNLLPDEFSARYSGAVASRLNGEFEPIRFIGEDIRKIKNKK